MGKPSLSDDDKDLLQELLGSPGWRIILNAVLSKELERHALDVFNYSRKHDGAHAAAVACGKYDGIISLVEAVYNAVSEDIPERLKVIRRGI